MPNVQWITPDDWQRNCPIHVKFRTRINLEISASVGFIVKKFITMQGHVNVKSVYNLFMEASCTQLCYMKLNTVYAGRKELRES